jgi:hypothetical protein
VVANTGDGPGADAAAAAAATNTGEGRHITVGYTCGLWTLFHMVTFAAPRAGLTPQESSGAIRTYVEHFFGCSHCRDHFLTLFDACDFGRCEGVKQDARLTDEALQRRRRRGAASGGGGGGVVGGSGEASEEAGVDSGDNGNGGGEAAFDEAHKATALWLWRAHNAVNVRVAHEALQDEALAKQEEERKEKKKRRNAGQGGQEEEEEGEESGADTQQVVDLDPSWALWPPPDQCPQCWKKGKPEQQALGGWSRVVEEGGGSGGSGGSGGRGGRAVWGSKRGSEAAEFDEDEVYAFLVKAYDAGLWERSSLALLAEEAGDAKARLRHGLSRFFGGDASWYEG